MYPFLYQHLIPQFVSVLLFSGCFTLRASGATEESILFNINLGLGKRKG